MPDKYDLEIERLRALPNRKFLREVERCWAHADTLFQYLTPDGLRSGPDDKKYGCPTMVKRMKYPGDVAWTDKLTKRVRALPLPTSINGATKDNLSVFAAAQRLADKLLNRK